MFLIPLNQIESVELVIHALKAAGGAVDCTSCPAHRVCMRQCLTIAAAIEGMVGDESLPSLALSSEEESAAPAPEPTPADEKGSHLKRIK